MVSVAMIERSKGDLDQAPEPNLTDGRRAQGSEPGAGNLRGNLSCARKMGTRARPQPDSGSAREVADGSLGDLASPDATGAGVDALGGTIDDGTHLLDVRVPATLRPPVGVTDIHSEPRLLAADLTNRCHDTPTSSKNLWVSRKG